MAEQNYQKDLAIVLTPRQYERFVRERLWQRVSTENVFPKEFNGMRIIVKELSDLVIVDDPFKAYLRWKSKQK
jgi:hypothetical protein